MKLGYARVSTEDQRLEIQRTRLTEAGCGRLFEERISGAARQRPALERLLEELRAEDILVVTRLDRLARSTSELLRLAEVIAGKRPRPNSSVISRHFGSGQGGDARGHVQLEPPVGVYVSPEQRCQRVQVARGQPSLPRGPGEHLLDHE